MANEYQMRLKDMHASEKIKEVGDKLTHEIEGLKQQLELLRVDKVRKSHAKSFLEYVMWLTCV